MRGRLGWGISSPGLELFWRVACGFAPKNRGVGVVSAPICLNLLRLDVYLGAIWRAFAAYLCTFWMHFSSGFQRRMGVSRGCGCGLHLGSDWGLDITSSIMRFWGVNYSVTGVAVVLYA